MSDFFLIRSNFNVVSMHADVVERKASGEAEGEIKLAEQQREEIKRSVKECKNRICEP